MISVQGLGESSGIQVFTKDHGGFSPEEIAEVALNFLMQFVPVWGAEVWSHDLEGQTVLLLAQRLVDGEDERPLQDPIQPAASMLSENHQAPILSVRWKRLEKRVNW